MATYITIETDKKIAYQIDGGEKNVMFANVEDDGYPEPTGTKQISITQNGTTTDNVKDYASAEITVNVQSGSTTLYIGSDNSSFGNMWPDLDAAGIKTLDIYVDTWNNRQIPSVLGNINVETINLEYATGFVPSSMRDFLRGWWRSKDGGLQAFKLKTVNLINVDTSAITDWFSAFTGDFNDITINGTLNMAAYSSGNPFNGGFGIKEMRFTPNALPAGMTISNGNQATWSDDTWVSFANSLKAGVAETLTIGATAQTRLAGIMGTVVDGTFTLDDSGTTSLQSFITNTKGWTLA